LLLQALATRTSLSIKTPLVQLPKDESLIVDREAEIALLLNELKKPDGLRVLPVIAPSGFGKTSFYRALIDEGRFALRNEFARAFANKGLVLRAQEDYDSAYSHLNEAVSLVEECVKAGQEQFRGMLDKMTNLRDAVRKLASDEL
jgi:hypothetical protein